MSNHETPAEIVPVVGMGATLDFPQDAYPYVITSVSASGKTITVARLTIISKDTGHAPARFDGPFPVWSHTYTPEEIARFTPEDPATLTVRRTKNGWVSGGLWFHVGTAHYHRNYSY